MADKMYTMDDFSSGRHVIKFFAKWCGPCRMYEPVFNKIAERFKDKAEFHSIDIEEEGKELANELQIRTVPITFIIDNGEIKDLIPGIDGDDLVSALLSLED